MPLRPDGGRGRGTAVLPLPRLLQNPAGLHVPGARTTGRSGRSGERPPGILQPLQPGGRVMATDVGHERSKEIAQEFSKLQFWIMGGLLSLLLVGAGWVIKDLSDRQTKAEAKHATELATLQSTNTIRGERLAEAMTKI